MRRTLKGEAIEARPVEHAGGARKKEREALNLLELARPALDKARQYLYDRNAEYEELVRRIDIGQSAVERALAVCPDLAVAHYLHGIALDLRGDDAAAEAAWREALRLDPDFGPAHFHLGCLLVETAYVSSRISRFKTEATRMLGEAIGAFEKALAQGSGFDEAVQKDVARAMTALFKPDPDAAARICREALEAWPGAAGLESLYWVLGLCSEDEAANDALEKALEIRPKYPVVLFKLGNNLENKGDLERAEKCFTDATRLKPGFVAALHNLCPILIQRGQYRRAKEILTALVASHPGLDRPLITLSSAHEALGEMDQAFACLNEAIRLTSGEPMAWNSRGALHDRQGNIEAALRDYEQALRLRPDHAVTLCNRACILADLGFPNDAMEDFEAALAAEPRNTTAHHDRGWLLLEQGEFERAIAEFRIVLDIDPFDQGSEVGTAEALRLKGEPAEAMKRFDQILERYPMEFDGRVGRGLCRLALGDRVGGIDDLRRALEATTPVWKRKRREIAEAALRGAESASL